MKNLTPEFKAHRAEIPWKLIAGTRDKLIHGYFEVDYDLVWDMLEQDIPSLDTAAEKFLTDQYE